MRISCLKIILPKGVILAKSIFYDMVIDSVGVAVSATF